MLSTKKIMETPIFSSLPSVNGKVPCYEWKFILTFSSTHLRSERYILTNSKELTTRDYNNTRQKVTEQHMAEPNTVILEHVTRFKTTDADQEANAYNPEDEIPEADVLEFLAKLPEARPHLEREANKLDFAYFSYGDLWKAEVWVQNTQSAQRHRALLGK